MKNILVVAAHSDDEAIGCGGTIAKLASEGNIVHVIFMTNGVGSRNTSKQAIKKRRFQSQKAAEILGIKSVENFDFPDNQMDVVPLLKIVKLIEYKISEFKPQIIFTHHLSDLNIDHQITHKALLTACRPKPGFCVKEIFSFEVNSSTEWQTPGNYPFIPNYFIDITNYVEVKQKALFAYSDEMLEEPHSRSINNIIRLNNLRGNSVGLGFSEAFSVVRIIH